MQERSVHCLFKRIGGQILNLSAILNTIYCTIGYICYIIKCPSDLMFTVKKKFGITFIYTVYIKIIVVF